MANEFIPKFAKDSLQGKVFVIAGGSTGIGAAFVTLLGQNGAYLVVGDVNETGAAIVEGLCDEYPSKDGAKPRAIFQRSDISSYEDNLKLFETALKAYGHIDHAVANAGVAFERQAPTTKVLDINLIGCAYFARIAAVYLKENRPKGADRSITLLASCAGIKETPGMFLYTASKHGVIGLMRSLRPYLPETHDIRINTVSPWMTISAITGGIVKPWKEAGLPMNQPEDVAKVMAAVISDQRLHGKNMYVAGARAWETEEGILRTEPHWLGEIPSAWLEKGQAALGNGASWSDKP
ncbi:hypothetical protein KEM52_001828 [Ascosphaera acerosa]|nr:hypothetical protein KEM52_001828 [Ascosphaera acerosa]